MNYKIASAVLLAAVGFGSVAAANSAEATPKVFTKCSARHYRPLLACVNQGPASKVQDCQPLGTPHTFCKPVRSALPKGAAR